MKFCPNCGFKLGVSGAKFCYECGYKLSEVKVEEEKKEVKKETSKVNTYEEIENGVLKAYKGDESTYAISKGVTTIYKNSITSPSIKRLVIPSSVTLTSDPLVIIEIDNDTNEYKGCHNLEWIDVDESNPNFKSIDGNLYNKNGTVLIQYAVGKNEEVFVMPEGVERVGQGALYGAKNLKKIVLPKSFGPNDFIITPVGHYIDLEINEKNPNYKIVGSSVYSKDGTVFVLYNGRETEKSYIVPNGVKRIEDNAFNSVDFLESINLPNGIVSLGESAFFGCTNLNSINLPNTITSIGSYCFSYCKELENITLPNKLEEINEYTFEGSGLVNVVIPSSVKLIREGAFSGADNLVGVFIPSSVKTIEFEAFSDCSKLKDVIIFEGLSYIGSFAFGYCSSLVTIKLPKSVKTIEEDAFSECESLKTIYVAKGKQYGLLEDNLVKYY